MTLTSHTEATDTETDHPAPDAARRSSAVRVVLFSKFTAELTREIARKLRSRHGVDVVRIEGLGIGANGSRPSKQIDLTGIDAALALHEYASHSDVTAVREIAKAQKIPSFNLSRKASAWTTQLAPMFRMLKRRSNASDYYKRTKTGVVKTGAAKPERLAVSDADLPQMLQDVRTAREQGKDWPEIAGIVSCYWRTGVVPTPGAVAQMCYGAARRAACPDWWEAWYASQKRSYTKRADDAPPVRHIDPATVDAQPRERDSQIDMGPKAAFPPLALVAETPTQRPANASDAELLALYEEDNQKLATRVKNLSDLVETYRKRADLAERRATEKGAEPTGDLSAGMVVVIESFANQVTYGAIDPMQAFDLLVRYARKHTEGT